MNQNPKPPAFQANFNNAQQQEVGDGGGGERRHHQDHVKKEKEEEEKEESWESVDEDELNELFFAEEQVELPIPTQQRLVMPAHAASSVATAKTIEDFVKAWYESERVHAEHVKSWSIMAPPDKPNLTTVPWQVEMITKQISNKSELSKRTETSNATTQKKKPNATGGGGKRGKKQKK